MKKIITLICLMLFSSLVQAATGEQLFKKVDASVVSIQHERAGGSGFIISEDGYILTNGHVISMMDTENPNDVAKRITVVLENEKKYQARVIGFCLDPDVALLKIEAEETLKPVVIADATQVKTGHVCYAFGAPLGLKRTMTRGIISNTAQTSIGTFTKVFQTDAAINPGNSGGPLFNDAGEVIGINTYGGQSSGIGFSIPISYAMTMQKHYRKHGRFVRADLPLMITKAMTEELAQVLNAPQGMFIDYVLAGSAADKAGFRAGDIISTMNGKKISGSSEEDSYEFNWNFVTLEVGSTVRLGLLRKQPNGKYTELKLSASLVEDEPKPSYGYQIGEIPEIKYPEIGLGVQRITLTTWMMFSLPVREGVRVTSVVRSAPANKGRIYSGDVITAVNDIKVSSDKQFRARVDKLMKEQTKFLIFNTRRGNDTSRNVVKVHYPLKQRNILFISDDKQRSSDRFYIRRLKLAGANVVTTDKLDADILAQDWDAVLITHAHSDNELTGMAELLEKSVDSKRPLGLVEHAPRYLKQGPKSLKEKKMTMDKEHSPELISKGFNYTGKDVEIDGKLITTTGFDKKIAREFIAAFISMASQSN